MFDAGSALSMSVRGSSDVILLSEQMQEPLLHRFLDLCFLLKMVEA